ncbi:TonB-dependent receptor plug domain-containing protein [Methylobacter sp. YRD-M1]|uniref:TonB-dependent receptor plug domain-containing protein n=1 Tax=Methylobacter sp. YRD-M1 TaxID=2911520 RepID=UPI00227A24C3|nr:TonB-dependent receptor [Methylobacter sp. YRD-M1]WAK03449.1 TonB-dependent receptor [Methylobacter sp. YRD-M1]
MAMRKEFLIPLMCVVSMLQISRAFAAAPPMMSKENIEASLDEELGWLQEESVIFSASRREQKVSQTSAAVFVIGNDDIRRSGVTSIPDALRMVPGLQVAQVNANTWAITARGFNGENANKLLVMIDGRTVYHPTFSGTLWRTKDVLLEDVERIEVIRGPGAAMWGANAVNGVINVITRSAVNTYHGLSVTAGGGSEDRALGAIRYSGKLTDTLHYRTYVKYNDRDNLKFEGGGNPNDSWEKFQGGFRIDGDLTPHDSLTLQGDLYKGNGGSLRDVTAPVAPFTSRSNVGEDFSGGNILSRWKHRFSDTSDLSLQLYFDRTQDRTTYSAFNDASEAVINTYDADLQHYFQLGDRQEVTWGLGFRYIEDDQDNAVNFSFAPASRDYLLYSAFIQDQVTLVPDTLKLLFGSKFEHNDFSGFQIQPNARFIYTPDNQQALWAAVSYAVRTPNRLDQDTNLLYFSQLSANGFSALRGNRNFDSEELVAYELGYRIAPKENISIDVAAFYNVYDKLRSVEAGVPFAEIVDAASYSIIPVTYGNNARGETYGLETAAQWQALKWWRLEASYSYLQIQLHTDSASLFQDVEEGQSPHHQFNFRSSMDLPHDVQLDAFLRYVDKLRYKDYDPERKIDSYLEMDVRLGWKPVKNIELSISGRNLLDSSHAEFIALRRDMPVIEVQRSVFGQVSLDF